MNERILALLADSPLFGAFAPEARLACAERFHEVRYKKHEMLFARGDPGNHLYIVSEGQVRLAIATSEGRELSFQIVGPGELFGEIGVLDGRGRSAEAVSLEPTVAFSLGRANFQQLRHAHPSMSDAVIVFLCSRLRQVSDKMEVIALFPLEVRLARFLLTSLAGIADTPGRRTALELGYSQTELAQLLCASRPKLNAALGALERAGAIKRTSDRLFCDRTKLTRMSDYDDD